MGNELFQPGPGKFLFLVLTYHPTISLFSPKYWIRRDKRSRNYHVEGELLTYIRRHVHDALIYTGSSASKGPPKGCTGKAFEDMVNILFQDGKPLPPFVLPTDISPRVRSLNKCGRHIPKKTFDHAAFKAGDPTPKVVWLKFWPTLLHILYCLLLYACSVWWNFLRVAKVLCRIGSTDLPKTAPSPPPPCLGQACLSRASPGKGWSLINRSLGSDSRSFHN